ncbi:MAG TPA: hypothetical protein VFI54_22705 [Solirubrobacteraceae bacterium]|nr:hypothetical protein [Solirubrobacteraceae bacterium]
MTAILPDIVDEARRVLDAAERQGTTLALLGGIAVRLHASEIPPSLDREYKDIDFAVPKGGGRPAADLLEALDYDPSREFNALQGRERLLFLDPEHGRQVDVFVGSFRMCHEVSFNGRLSPGQQTVPLAELVLTKLQIIELNEKDVRDTILLFYGHDVSDHDDESINGERIAELCAGDWGLWRTLTQNLERCREHLGDYALPDQDAQLVSGRVTALLRMIEDKPKSRGWRLRARVGERKRWYELPDEVA